MDKFEIAVYNLTTNHFRIGDRIIEARNHEDWVNAYEKGRPAWCYYENDSTSAPMFGKIYNVHAVMDPRGFPINHQKNLSLFPSRYRSALNEVRDFEGGLTGNQARFWTITEDKFSDTEDSPRAFYVWRVGLDSIAPVHLGTAYSDSGY